MQLDALSVTLRAWSFIALFQAAGAALFLALLGRRLEASAPVRRIARLSAIAALGLLPAQYALEAARMAGDLSGMFDGSLQTMVSRSAGASVLAVRMLGLAVIAVAAGRRNDIAATFGAVGAATVAASFLLIGHTLGSPMRWLLAPLLLLHIVVVAFWFGALMPLYAASLCETPAVAARVTAEFSRLAVWLVPGILVAGSLVAWVLIPNLAMFGRPYGELLIAKLAGFAVLMGMAALNKWRLGPALAAGERRAHRTFRRSLAVEYVLMAAVLGVTAVMTALFSPDG